MIGRPQPAPVIPSIKKCEGAAMAPSLFCIFRVPQTPEVSETSGVLIYLFD